MTYQIVDWLISYIECFVMLVVVTESGGRKFEEKKQAYLLLSFSLLNAILVAVCNQISAFSFITPVLSILYLTVISRILSRGNFLLRISISITTMFVILTTGYILMVIFCWLYGGDQFSIAFNVFMTPGPLRCLYLVLDKITDIALYMAARKYLPKLSELKSCWLITLLFSGSLVYLILFNFNIILCHAFPITAEQLRKRARKCAKTAFTTHKSVNGAELSNAA